MESSSGPVKRYRRGYDMRGRPIRTLYDWEAIAQLLIAGKTGLEVADELNISHGAVLNAASKLGIALPKGRKRTNPIPTRQLAPQIKEFIALLEDRNIRFLAERSGYDMSQLHEYRRGRRIPNHQVFHDVLQAMGYRIRLEPINEITFFKKGKAT